MVVAFLRGLLKPELNYGVRSVVAENLILEALEADELARSYDYQALTKNITLALMTPKHRRSILESAGAQHQRASQLRSYDIYALEHGKPALSPSGVSVFQLYQMMSKRGILAALSEASNPTTPDSP